MSASTMLNLLLYDGLKVGTSSSIQVVAQSLPEVKQISGCETNTITLNYKVDCGTRTEFYIRKRVRGNLRLIESNKTPKLLSGLL